MLILIVPDKQQQKIFVKNMVIQRGIRNKLIIIIAELVYIVHACNMSHGVFRWLKHKIIHVRSPGGFCFAEICFKRKQIYCRNIVHHFSISIMYNTYELVHYLRQISKITI